MKTRSWVVLGVILLTSHGPLNGMNAQEADSLSIWVNGLCGMCKTRIERAALKVRGVQTASWDAETRVLSATVNPEKFKEKKPVNYSMSGTFKEDDVIDHKTFGMGIVISATIHGAANHAASPITSQKLSHAHRSTFFSGA